MLPKPGKDLYQTTSYRPISLLPVCSKILEKILYDRLKATIEEEKLISGRQYGFRNKHSTIEQMHRLINEILLAIEKKQYCTALFMDIEKVFDKVNHKSLLQTIKKHFPEQIHHFLKSYLSNRTFVVKIKDVYSEVKDIKAGIPQGSVLGTDYTWPTYQQLPRPKY